MNTCLKRLLLSVFGVLLGQHAYAGSPGQIDTLTCTRSNGSTLKHNVYAFTLGTGKTNPRYFTVYFLDNLLGTYTSEEIFGSGFEYCQFGKLTGDYFENATVIDVTTSGVGPNVGALAIGQDTVSQAYTEVTFQYTFLVFEEVPTPAIPLSSPDEQAKALAAFKAKGLAIPK